MRDAQPSVATRWGRVRPHCAEPFAVFRWREVASRTLHLRRHLPQNQDLPSLDDDAAVAILELAGERADGATLAPAPAPATP